MDKMKVCFVGVGSIAKRHIKNLKEICKSQNIELTIDAYRHSKSECSEKSVDSVYHDLMNVPNDYDVIFITNPTEYHLKSLMDFHDKGKHFFIEKPVVSLQQIKEAKCFSFKTDSVYYVACPLRYNAVIQYLKQHIDPNDVISVRSISSSYLPDWRPGQDYRNTYSAHRNLGGGVSVDLIHEWDYLTYLFGWPEKVYHMIGKKSALEIDSDDYAIYIADFKNKIAELHLDYFGRKTIREIELFTHRETIVGDIVSGQISFLTNGNRIEFHEERDDYQKRELNFFLDMVIGKRLPEESFLHGVKVLELTQGITTSISLYAGRQS